MRRLIRFILGIGLSISLAIIPIQVHAAEKTAYVDDAASLTSAMANPDIETVKLNSDIFLELSNANLRSSTGKKILDVNGYQLHSALGMQYGFHILEDYESLELILKDSSPGTTGEFYSHYYNLIRVWNLATVNKFTLRIVNGNFKLDKIEAFFWIVNQGENIIPNIEVIIEDGKFEGGNQLIDTGNNITLSIKEMVYDCGDTKKAFWYNDTKLKDIIDVDSYLLVDGSKYEELDDKVKDVKAFTFEVIPKDEVNEFSVTFVDYDDTVLDIQTVIEGANAVAPENPTREDYKFVGWDTDFTNVQSDLTVKAMYEEIVTTAEVSTFEEYIDALYDEDIIYIKLIADFERTDENLNNDVESYKKLKEIDFNGHTITTDYTQKFNVRNYDEFEIIFKDSSPSQTGGYFSFDHLQDVLEFYGYSNDNLTARILSGNFVKDASTGSLFSMLAAGYDADHNINLIIEGGYFEGSYSFSRTQTSGIRTIELKELVYNVKPGGSGVRLQQSTVLLKDMIDTDNYEMFVDGNKVLDYNTEANEHVGKKIEIKAKFKTELVISGLIDNQTFTFDYSPKTPEGTLVVEGGHVPVSELEVLYEGKGSTSYSSVDAPVNAGEYKVTYKIPNSNLEYFGSVTYNFEIEKADPYIPMVVDRFGYVGETLSTVILPDGFTWENPTIIMDTVGINAFKATYTPDDLDNYNIKTDLDIDVDVRDSLKTVLTISGLTDNESFVYNGSSQKPTGTITVQDDLVPVSELEVKYVGTGSTVFDSTTPPTDVGTYQVTYRIPSSNPTYTGFVTYNFEVTKLTPSYTIPTSLIGVVDDELSTIVLPDGFVWQYAADIMSIPGNQTFDAVYIPDDSHNYETITGISVPVYVKDKYLVSTSAVGNGSINVGGTFIEGETFTVILTPAANHYLKELNVNGITQSVSSNTVDLVVDSDLDIVAEFDVFTYNVAIVDFDINGVDVNPNGVLLIPHGDDVDILVDVKPGYKVVEVLVNGVDKKSDLVGNLLTLYNVIEDMTVKVNVVKIVYPFIKGADGEFTLEDSNGLVFILDAELANFLGIELNGTLIDPVHYDAKSGSVIVTIKATFMNTLKPGTYEFTFLFADGAVSQTNVTVLAAKPTLPQTGLSNNAYTAALTLIGLGIILILKKKEDSES